MIDLLLVHPPHRKALSGLTIPTLKQYLESKGFNIHTIEKPQSNEEIIDFVQIFHPRFVGVSVPFTFYAPNAIKLIHSLKLLSDSKIVVGGAHVTICKDDFQDADYICQGYGEQYLLNLLSDKEPVPGVDMDDLPCIYDPNNVDIMPNGIKFIRYMGCRGCIFNCSFCPNNFLSGGKVHPRSINKIIEDLKIFKYKYHVNNFIFSDETFTLNRKRVIEICTRMREEKLDLHWWCQSRANLIDKDLLKLMKQAGCIGMSIGVESGDKRVLNECNKGLTLNDISSAVKLCNELNILLYGGFIIGHPGDTIASVKTTVEFACNSSFDYIGFGLMIPFPGTKVREQAEKDGKILCNDFDRYHIGELLYCPPGLQGINLKHLLWWSYGKFFLSSPHKFWFGLLGFFRQSGWKPKADFIRRIYHGIIGLSFHYNNH